MWEKLVDANTEGFIITYSKPYKPASSDTISRWIKNELGIAGINTNVYKPQTVGLPQQVRQGLMGLALQTF